MRHPKRRNHISLCIVLAVGAGACSSDDNPSEEVQGSSTAAAKPSQPSPKPTQVVADASALPVDTEQPTHHPSAYDKSSGRFVVHEWGTLTSVVASDGHLLPGLHHEEEDLPGFVADRMAQAQQTPVIVQQKMETPVTYFYSQQPRRVQVAVAFPKGIFTQWFPYVQHTSPSLYLTDPMDPTTIVDPWISSAVPLTPICEANKAAGEVDGLLDWGTVDILAPTDAPMLPGPTNDTTWDFARQTQSNALRVKVAQRDYHEKFLFYRGTGNFKLPLLATTTEQGVKVVNTDAALVMRNVFVLNVTAQGAGFVALGDVSPGTAAGISAALPPADMLHNSFKQALGDELVRALVATGLFDDEARAMVATWERSYFLTPGARLLYLLPQTITERIIPLRVTPAPDEMLRAMVIRVELTPPALERTLDESLTQLAQTATHDAARKSWLAYGRFAEPYLSGALQRATPPADRTAGQTLLAEVRAKRRWKPTSAE